MEVLIMAEYIERSAAIKAAKHAWAKGLEPSQYIEALPAADVAPVVRCKDCKHKGWVQEPCHGKSVDYCKVWDCTLRNLETTFCSYGERKDGGDG
jgi:hypothetical protein